MRRRAAEYTFITEDRLRRAGNRGRPRSSAANNKALFSVPIVSVRIFNTGLTVQYDYVQTGTIWAAR